MWARALLAWFAAGARDLPWREPSPRDPWRVLVSELMLQQTRVETVARRFDAFVREFPSPEALAAAEDERLMKAWEGLGYYRRARSLREAARAIVSRHGGRVPASLAELRALPGVGPYTAGAVASLAFGVAAPAVDGNVLRVWSRVAMDARDVGASSARRGAEAWVADHQPREVAGAFNEALMELGATVCTPRAPKCGACPLRAHCLAAAAGRASEFPVKARSSAPVRVRVALAVARRGGALLLERREEGLLAGTWGLPWVEVGEGADASGLLAAKVASLTGGDARVGGLVARGRHAFTHRRWEMEAFAVECDGVGGAWLDPGAVALGTAHRRLLERV